MVSYSTINIVDIVIDEIALEGLDGITLEALWQRLSLRLQEPPPLAKAFMEQVWAICVEVDGVDYYELKIPREKLVIFDRYEFIDPDLGTILEPDEVPNDIYPHSPIDDVVNGVRGSCSTYNTRKKITQHVRTLTVDQAATEFGEKLVLVCTQALREEALMGDGVCPTLELTVMQHCFLERVGRSRYHGEVTQGKISLALLKEDPKSLFYHRKFLIDHKLITKQIHHQKSGGHSCSGSLLHLPRFYVERKPKAIYLAEQVIEILKSKRNCVAEYDEIKKELQIENSIKKLFKTAFFQKVCKTDLRVPYRTIYPKAEDKEWQQKNNNTKEKSIRVVQLLDPDFDVSELWGKEEIVDDDEPYELDISNLKLNVPLLKQANRIVEQSGPNGISQCQVAKIMGQTKLQARTILRNLVRLKIVATFMNDVGRQRVTKFVSKKYEKNSEMSKQFEQEMDKIKELTKMMDVKKTTEQTVDDTVKVEDSSRGSESTNKKLSAEDQESTEATTSEKRDENLMTSSEAMEHCKIDEELIKLKFSIVHQVLKKYGLTKFVKKYRRTSSNFDKKDRLTRCENSLPSLNKIEQNRARLTEQILEEQNKRTPNCNSSEQAEVISYFDSIEVKLVELRPQHKIGKPTHQVVGFIEDLDINEKKNISSITYRLLKRANMIIESVKEHKVIDDLTKLMKMINEEEDKKGYDYKIDKKSLTRLLQKLAKDNVIKNIKLTLRANKREKTLNFICDPSIGIDHTVIQSAVEQAKIKFCLLGSQKIKAMIQSQQKQDEDASAGHMEGVNSLKVSDLSDKASLSTTGSLKYDFKAGKRYGYSPKFVRMKVLHIFLFYSVYDHPGEPTESKDAQVANLRKNGYEIDAELEEEMSTVYNSEIGWKMFIPPLPKHAGWPEGWTIMCDVLLRMPLSTFIKLHNVPYSIPELMNYLNHPIKKHFLVKNLPSHIRNTLLIARKYIYTIHESVTRLCYLGLIQFGPQKLKEKDQVFIFVNRKTEMTDTTSSAAGYHKVENKEYPRISYVFDSLSIVEKYWYDMWNTCINTCLGGRLVVQGKDILLEDLIKKPDMIKAVKARAPEEALLLDNGFVPGDRRGAAGVDSAFFAHLKRNWNWGTDNANRQYSRGEERKKIEQQRSTYLSKIKAKPLKFTEFAGLKKVTGPVTQHAAELRKKLHQKQKHAEDQKSKQQKYQKLVSQHVSKQKSFVRRVLPRKRKLRPRVKYDEVDFCALQQMEKLRVDWNPHEDNILLMCKVAMMYLCPNPRKQLITFTSVRDILRTYSAHSYNKTSRACQRRVMYMCRRPQTVNSVALGVEEIKQNYYINKRFGGIVDRLKSECQNTYEYEEQVAKAFKELVTYIDKRYYNISDMESRESVPIPKTIQEFNLIYKLKHPTRQSSLHGFTKDIKCVNGIHSATVNSVIHSSMCCGKDRSSWAYQLFRVYQQYPESLLRSAMGKIRSDQMVSIKKSYMCALKKYGNCMPMSSSQYQLSTGYIYKFQTKWPYEIFNEAYQMMCKLASWQYENQSADTNYIVPEDVEGVETGHSTGGLVVGLHDYLARGQIDFDIEIPDQIIMLDPRLKEKDETYLRIAQRYNNILTSLDQLGLKKKDVVGTNLMDPEVEEEDEMERREFEDRIVKEKRDKEDRDRRNYWKSRNDEVGKCLEENEIKLQREKEDKERREKRDKFDNTMTIRKQKYAQVLEFGEDNVPEAIISEFRNIEDDKGDSESDQEENEEADEDEDYHTIRFQDGTLITLSKEDIEDSSCNSDEGESQEYKKDINKSLVSNKKLGRSIANTPSQKRKDNDTNDEEVRCNKKAKLDSDTSETPTQENELSSTPEKIQVCSESNTEDPSAKRARSNSADDKVTDEQPQKRLRADDGENVKPDMTIVAESGTDATIEPKVSGGTRVNAVIKKMHAHVGAEYGGGEIEDVNDMQKRCTRIALLMMREELNDLAVSDNHHAHDYFVVNTFKILCSFKLKETDEPRSLECFQNMKVPVDILPLNTRLAKQLIEDLKKYALFPKDPTPYEDFLNEVGDALGQADLDTLGTLHKYVRDKKEIGATSKQIVSKFKSVCRSRLLRLISLLTEHRIFLRSGVITVRYIHQQFADPWLIHSYKILRRDKESLPAIASGNFYLPEFEDKAEWSEKQASDNDLSNDTSLEKVVVIGNEDNTVVDNQSAEKKDKSEIDGSEGGQNGAGIGRRMQRKRTALLQSKDIQKAAKKLDFNTAAAIKVVIKPWIRIDGVLNRRVLDRMLGAVLAYCINHPGVIMSKVQRRFMPALQPFHTTELIEMLAKLECVVIKVLHKPKVTLFSKPITTRLGPTTGFDSEEEVIIEPDIDASIKFGMFLGNKAYTVDFLS
ncbi:general transcription factor 3C polypeptide 1 isoform X2 [Athalia rosae]|uniref:general transcription factor 3C polypeptide 1 isoform X2 n=1 Tax=Athalia rosae TaxID=37344 RepID=UPI002033B7F9|nr:general transcription factor 3C polypeptide 1 isoform X2 [Athalia rosae]